MADWHVYNRRSSPSTDGDFEEEEVWSVMNETEDSSLKIKDYYNNNKSSSNGSSSAWHVHSSPRKITRASSSTNEPKVVQQSSAPQNIPDWYKIYGKNVSNDSWGYDDHHNGNNGSDGYEYDDYKVPPHEYLAKKLARSQISSSSVYEGIGRTLKGRDLSKVRNAILTKTGFLE